MQHERGNSGSKVWRTWHEEREEARREEMDVSLFSPIEIEMFDLDTAEIDGSDNPRTYQTDPYGDDQESVDYREHDPRF